MTTRKDEMFRVTVDFGDNTTPLRRHLAGETDLGLYLERIPSMFGFNVNGQATIRIETIPKNHPVLPI